MDSKVIISILCVPCWTYSRSQSISEVEVHLKWSYLLDQIRPISPSSPISYINRSLCIQILCTDLKYARPPENRPRGKVRTRKEFQISEKLLGSIWTEFLPEINVGRAFELYNKGEGTQSIKGFRDIQQKRCPPKRCHYSTFYEWEW